MKIGDVHTEFIIITAELIQKFATFSQDFNPVHFNDAYAQTQGFKSRIAHGMLGASFFSKIFANDFPGPGTIYLSQNFSFHAPIYVDDEIKYVLEVIEQKESKPIFTIKTEAYGIDGKLRISGIAMIRTPREKN